MECRPNPPAKGMFRDFRLESSRPAELSLRIISATTHPAGWDDQPKKPIPITCDRATWPQPKWKSRPERHPWPAFRGRRNGRSLAAGDLVPDGHATRLHHQAKWGKADDRNDR